MPDFMYGRAIRSANTLARAAICRLADTQLLNAATDTITPTTAPTGAVGMCFNANFLLSSCQRATNRNHNFLNQSVFSQDSLDITSFSTLKTSSSMSSPTPQLFDSRIIPLIFSRVSFRKLLLTESLKRS